MYLCVIISESVCHAQGKSTIVIIILYVDESKGGHSRNVTEVGIYIEVLTEIFVDLYRSIEMCRDYVDSLLIVVKQY